MAKMFWSEQDFLRPLFVSDAAWQKILNNFLNHVGDPLEDLPGSLQDDIERLESIGFVVPDIYSFVQIATLTGVTGLTDESALVTNGNLIV